MTTAATISARLILDSQSYNSGLNDAEKKADSFSANVASKMKAVGDKMSSIGKSMSVGLTLPIIGAGAAMVSAASNLEESTNAVNVVFGEASQVLKDYGTTAAESVGLAQSEFNQLASVTGSFLTNLGYDQNAAAEETINLTERAADMASIFNTDVSSALQAIQSGLKGEFNPLEQFGVKMNAAALEAKALQMGLGEVTVDNLKLKDANLDVIKAQEAYNKAMEKYGDDTVQTTEAAITLEKAQQALSDAYAGEVGPLSDNAKAQAALALIYEQTDKLAGDFANTSDGLANSSRILKAELTDASAALGQQLLPYVLQGVQFLGGLVDKFKALSPEQQKWIVIILAVVAAIGPLMTIIGGLVSAIGAIIPVVSAVAGVLTFPLIAIIAAVIAVVALLYAAWTNNWGGIQEKFAAFVAWIKPIWDALWGGIVAVFTFVWEQIKIVWAAFQAAFNGDWYTFGELLRQVWDNIWKAISTIATQAWEAIKAGVATFIQNVISFFQNTDWGEVGRNILEGIVNGLDSLRDWAVQKIISIGEAMVSAFEGFFGIGSPSKLMEDEFKMLAAGANIGWESNLEFSPSAVMAAIPTPAPRPSAPVVQQPAAQSASPFGAPFDMTAFARAIAQEFQRAT